MSSRQFKAAVVLVVCFAAARAMTGCSYRYDYEIQGAIKSYPSGAGLSGVTVSMKDVTVDYIPVQTDADGKFVLKFGLWNPTPPLSETVILTKEGFKEETVLLDPIPFSDSNRQRTLIGLVAFMSEAMGAEEAP